MTMRIRVLTLFPEMFDQPMSASIIGRARENDVVCLTVHDIRDYTHDRHRTVDDEPYGGGPGMVMKAEPLQEGVDSLKREGDAERRTSLRAWCSCRRRARHFDQATADRLSTLKSVLIVCGHYEGVDERFIQRSVDEEISIGDFVLTGGELAAMVVIDAVVRLLPGALGPPRFGGGRLIRRCSGRNAPGPRVHEAEGLEGLRLCRMS